MEAQPLNQIDFAAVTARTRTDLCLMAILSMQKEKTVCGNRRPKDGQTNGQKGHI